MAMVIVLSLGAAAFAEGENGGTEPVKHTITVNAGTGGTATGGGQYAEGEPVVLSATPEAAYAFDKWTDGAGNLVSNGMMCTVYVGTVDATYTANFKDRHAEEVKYTITVSVAAGYEGGTVSGSGEYPQGTAVTLTATQDESHTFVKWVDAAGNTVSESAACTIIVGAEDATYYARFTPVTPPPTEKHWVVTSVKGNVGGYASAPAQYDEGAAFSVTATPLSGYVFEKWIISGTDKTANPYSGTMGTTDVTAVAVFKAAPVTNHTVSYYPGQYCTSTATYADTKTAGTPLALRGKTYSRSGYVQTGWCTDPYGLKGTYYPLEGWYTAEEDIMLFPYWNKTTDTYTITVRYIGNADAHGYISDAANNYIHDGQTFSISAGESHSFTVHTDPGYYAFKVWTEGPTSSRSHGAVYNGSSFSVVNPSENKILYVRFENAKYYPPTGDDSNLGLFAALTVISVLGLAVTVTVKKHEH